MACRDCGVFKGWAVPQLLLYITHFSEGTEIFKSLNAPLPASEQLPRGLRGRDAVPRATQALQVKHGSELNSSSSALAPPSPAYSNRTAGFPRTLLVLSSTLQFTRCCWFSLFILLNWAKNTLKRQQEHVADKSSLSTLKNRYLLIKILIILPAICILI